MTTNGLFYADAQVHTFKRQIYFLRPESKNWIKMIENMKLNDIFEWHKIIIFDMNCRWNERFEMVCGQK